MRTRLRTFSEKEDIVRRWGVGREREIKESNRSYKAMYHVTAEKFEKELQQNCSAFRHRSGRKK
jgi:hypothetical protein